ncbi:MFS transporter [Aeromicrobium sp. UC242_57]|uniref:MFS transporter n=1 Tax=Aeromicrobium sp. UC242_57 TaxID=3374624 RepID=UPI0037A9A5BA
MRGATVQTRFLLLAALRWLPTGLIVPVVALLPLDRGLSVAELGVAFAVQGVVVLFLELPTGGLSDALGRKPVVIAAGLAAAASYVAFALAQTLTAFIVATALSGVFRALDSGPLNAWFVDSVHDDRTVVDRSGTVARGLSRYASTVGVSIALGAVLSGVLISVSPFGRSESLAVPYWIAAAIALLQVIAVAVLMDEDRSGRTAGLIASVVGTPGVILAGARLLTRSRVLLALVMVELFWGFGMIAFETLMPIRLAELLGDRDHAAAVMGPVTAAAWGMSAVGAAAVPLLLRRWSLVQVSVALRILQGGTVVAMGLALGPIGLVAGLLATYALHSASGAICDIAARAGRQRAPRHCALVGVDADAAGRIHRRHRAGRDRDGCLDRYGDHRGRSGPGLGGTVVPGA